MLIKDSKDLENIFSKYKRNQQVLVDNEQDLNLMAIDFNTMLDRPTKQGCKNVVYINAIDSKGTTYMVKILNFRTFFYVKAPVFPDKNQIDNYLVHMKDYMNQCFENQQIIDRLELVQKESLMKFKGSKDASEQFIKIYINDYTQMNQVSKLLRKEIKIKDLNIYWQSESYESNVNFLLRFLVECNISGMSWFKLPNKKYKLCTKNEMSFCGNELEINSSDIIGYDSNDKEYSNIATLRLMSFDIECSSYGKFPNAEKDPIITIAMTCKNHNEQNIKHKVILQLDTCEDIINSDLYTFTNEQNLLEAFDLFISIYDPDVILGYNIISFDLKYLLDRRGQFKQMDQAYWGRSSSCSIYKQGKLNSKIMGFRETLEYNIFGRMIMDMYIHVMKEKKLTSYKLNSVAFEFLNEQKEEVHHTDISKLQDGSNTDRKRLAVYCLKDAVLPLKLCEQMKCIYNYIEMARVTGVPISFLFNRGQQIKVNSQILRKIKNTKLIIPVVQVNSDNSTNNYQGADVLTPKSGFYNTPIATLDFASLYPSIMISHNFCYSTLCSYQEIKDLKEGIDYKQTPNGNYFVTQNQRKGILPDILENLLKTRKIVKKELFQVQQELQELKLIEDLNQEQKNKILELENQKGVLDGRQLALKMSANSVYGFTGASRGFLPCLEIASSVTSIGRQMIFKTKEYVIQNYTKSNGYKEDADVIYGDTDSVMINFKTNDIKEAMELGKQAAQKLSELFIKPIKLEFEKVYYPYLLISKKRYAGLLWTNTDKPDKKDCKGVENVRRDSCQLVRKMVDKVLEIILYEQDFMKATEYVKGKIFDLFNNRIDISDLIISKSLSKPLDGENGYDSNLAHVALARRLQKEKDMHFSIGDRIPFVIVSKNKKAKQFEKSEDPNEAFINNIPLDLHYYLDRQIKPPLERIFGLVVNVSNIFEGDHTRVQRAQKLSKTGGIGKFFQGTVNKCMSCKKNIPTNNPKPVCKQCEDKEKEVYIKTTIDLKAKENEYRNLWSECQRCENSCLTEVICANTQCNIFFKRKKAQEQIIDLYKKFEKFNVQFIYYLIDLIYYVFILIFIIVYRLYLILQILQILVSYYIPLTFY